MLNMKSQCFGLELEFTGITRKVAAETIGKLLNGRAYAQYIGGAYRAYEVKGPDGRKWTVERDSSIMTRGGDETSCEFVTPKCTYDDIETIQEIIRELRRAGAVVNSSCGIHIHVDGSNHTAKSLKNLIYIFRSKEDMIYKGVGAEDRKQNRFCRPVGDELISNVQKIKSVDMENLSNAWYGTYAPHEHRGAHYNSSRYHGLNLHSMWYRGTVEFRLFHATLHAGKVRAYINLCLAMSAYAINSKRASVTTSYKRDEKHQMQCFLYHLGFKGDEWKTVRQHLLAGFSEEAAARRTAA